MKLWRPLKRADATELALRLAEVWPVSTWTIAVIRLGASYQRPRKT